MSFVSIFSIFVVRNRLIKGHAHGCLFLGFFDEQVRHMFDEIDYVLEAKNAERFASLYGLYPCKFLHACNSILAVRLSIYILLNFSHLVNP